MSMIIHDVWQKLKTRSIQYLFSGYVRSPQCNFTQIDFVIPKLRTLKSRKFLVDVGELMTNIQNGDNLLGFLIDWHFLGTLMGTPPPPSPAWQANSRPPNSKVYDSRSFHPPVYLIYIMGSPICRVQIENPGKNGRITYYKIKTLTSVRKVYTLQHGA